MIFLYILLAIFIFGALIFIHELGHFLVARMCGVKILEFAIGMGPKVLSKTSKKSGTKYSLRLFPIGGYVNMLGENGMEAVQGSSDPDQELQPENGESVLIQSVDGHAQETTDSDAASAPIDPELAKHAYCNQSVWKRILISLAGPAMNLLLGLILMFGLVLGSGEAAVGTTTVGGFHLEFESQNTELGFLPKDYLYQVRHEGEYVKVNSFDQLYQMMDAEESFLFDFILLRQEEGKAAVEVPLSVTLTKQEIAENFKQSLSAEKLKIGDRIIKVNNARVHTYHELSYEIMNQGYRPIDFTVERDGERIVIEDVQVSQAVDSKTNTVFGEMDFKVYREENFGFGTILKHTWYRSMSTVKMTFDSLGGLFSGRYGVEAVSGPVGITKTITDVAKTGLPNLIYLITIITINLAVMNLLPFPGLDGGHLMLYVIEIIRRKPVKREIEGIINFIGLAIILVLAVLIMIKDVIAL